MTRPVTARYMRATPDSTAVALKTWRSRRSPPAKTAAPSTSSRLQMTLPVMEAFTTAVWPARSATRAIINSAALPKVAFNRPPSPAPTRWAMASVLTPIQWANGTMASAARKKVATPPLKMAREEGGGHEHEQQDEDPVQRAPAETGRGGERGRHGRRAFSPEKRRPCKGQRLPKAGVARLRPLSRRLRAWPGDGA